MPFRYKGEEFRYSLYQWVRAEISKSTDDSRPESYKVDPDSLRLEEQVPPDKDGWALRERILFANKSWQFDTVEALVKAHADAGTSLGVVVPRQIVRVYLVERSEEEAGAFREKHQRLAKRNAHDRSQLRLIEGCETPVFKGLEYLPSRVVVNWLCQNPECRGHHMQILDWGTNELLRRGGPDKAIDAVARNIDLKTHTVRFFLGNMSRYPNSFCIAGMWYPKRRPASQFADVE